MTGVNMRMEWTVLGRSGGYPAPGEATSGYLLSAGDTHILVDCGAGVLAQLFRLIPLGELDAVILSHLHSDHISDLDVLKYALQMRRRAGEPLANLPVYLPAQPAESVPSADGVLDLRFYDSGDRIQIGPVGIELIAGEHPIPSYGMRFSAGGKIAAYTGDTRWCAAVPRMLADARLAFMDAGSLERLRAEPMVHMTARECAVAARECGVARAVLSHLVPHQPADETWAEAIEQYDRVELAQPLAVYRVADD